jgi:D-lactate dehydrogenase (cytochrome)
MNKILKVNKIDQDVVLEPGVSFAKLNQELTRLGLVFPLDAGPGASIGGMLACGASGIRAVRYGSIRYSIYTRKLVSNTLIKVGIEITCWRCEWCVPMAA